VLVVSYIIIMHSILDGLVPSGVKSEIKSDSPPRDKHGIPQPISLFVRTLAYLESVDESDAQIAKIIVLEQKTDDVLNALTPSVYAAVMWVNDQFHGKDPRPRIDGSEQEVVAFANIVHQKLALDRARRGLKGKEKWDYIRATRNRLFL
jgi:hypothetical protein